MTRTASTLPGGAWTALTLDAALIVVFAVLGRRAHESGLGLAGVLFTALPFLIAWGLALLVTRARRTWAQFWSAGIVVWLVTVIGGLGLRVVLGGTAALSFQLVTAGVLGVLLLGRRLVTSLALRPRLRAQS